MAHLTTLTEEQKLYVLERRAEFVSGARIAAEWKLAFPGSDVPTPQSLSVYDAESETGKRKLSDVHKAYFKRHRAAFLKDRSRIGLAHANYRLQALQSLLDDPVLSRNPEMVQSIVEMAEKIDGGMFKQRVQGPAPEDVGAYIRERMSEVKEAIDANVSSPEERNRVMAAIKEKRLASGGGPGGS